MGDEIFCADNSRASSSSGVKINQPFIGPYPNIVKKQVNKVKVDDPNNNHYSLGKTIDQVTIPGK